MEVYEYEHHIDIFLTTMKAPGAARITIYKGRGFDEEKQSAAISWPALGACSPTETHLFSSALNHAVYLAQICDERMDENPRYTGVMGTTIYAKTKSGICLHFDAKEAPSCWWVTLDPQGTKDTLTTILHALPHARRGWGELAWKDDEGKVVDPSRW